MNHSDDDLKQRFSRLRTEERAALPEAPGVCAAAPTRARRPAEKTVHFPWRRALPGVAAAAAAVALLLWHRAGETPLPSPPSLTVLGAEPLLPPATGEAPLFAHVTAPSGLPSDELLPFHLTVALFE